MFSALKRIGVDEMALQLRAWAAQPLVRSVDAQDAAEVALELGLEPDLGLDEDTPAADEDMDSADGAGAAQGEQR
jgi:hypothetical protein